MQYGANCRIRKVRKDKIRLNPVEARSLEGLDASGRLGLELFMYPNWFSSRLFYHLKGDEEIFYRVLQFSFDNTCRYYLAFASLFPTLFLLIVVVFVINYSLECFANLGIAYIYHSTHILFEYKLVLVFFEIGGLNIH